MKGYYYTDSITEKFSTEETLGIPLIKPKEEEFLKHCCSLMTFKEIGELMSLSEKTIQHYAERISKRLSIKNNRLAFAMYSLRNGIGKYDN
jgi:DNA-binding NarL/FixJ family response regulator